MSNRKSTFAIIATLIATLSLPVAANELLPQQHYADELQRCITSIRAELPVDNDTRLQHRVMDVSKKANWYQFAISTVLDGPGEIPLAQSECRAWRFEDKAVADVKPVLSGTALAKLQ